MRRRTHWRRRHRRVEGRCGRAAWAGDHRGGRPLIGRAYDPPMTGERASAGGSAMSGAGPLPARSRRTRHPRRCRPPHLSSATTPRPPASHRDRCRRGDLHRADRRGGGGRRGGDRGLVRVGRRGRGRRWCGGGGRARWHESRPRSSSSTPTDGSSAMPDSWVGVSTRGDVRGLGAATFPDDGERAGQLEQILSGVPRQIVFLGIDPETLGTPFVTNTNVVAVPTTAVSDSLDDLEEAAPVEVEQTTGASQVGEPGRASRSRPARRCGSSTSRRRWVSCSTTCSRATRCGR